jgi:hypothetical protein
MGSCIGAGSGRNQSRPGDCGTPAVAQAGGCPGVSWTLSGRSEHFAPLQATSTPSGAVILVSGCAAEGPETHLEIQNRSFPRRDLSKPSVSARSEIEPFCGTISAS